MPPTPPTHRHLHNVTPTVTQIHLLWLFCLEKAEELISLMGRTVTGKGRITKLYTCNKMCWFKIGLEINPTKPGKRSQRGEAKKPLKPCEGSKKKKKKKNPNHTISAKARGVI